MQDTKDEAPKTSVVFARSSLASVLQQLCRVLLHTTNPKDNFELKTETVNCRRMSKTGVRRQCSRKRHVSTCKDLPFDGEVSSRLVSSFISGNDDEECRSENAIARRSQIYPVDKILHFQIHDWIRPQNDYSATEPAFSSISRIPLLADPAFTRGSTETNTNFIAVGRLRKKYSFVHWFTIIALFMILHASLSHAFPTLPSSKDSLPSFPPTVEDAGEWTTLTRHTRASRVGTRSPRSRHERGIPGFLSKHTSPQRLYSRNSYFLEITKSGKVRGTTNRNSQYSLMRLESISAGVIAIYGTKSERYLAMNRKGNVYGSKRFNEECKFLEKMASGRYFYYQGNVIPRKGGRRRAKPPKARYVGFDKTGKVKRGHRIKNSNKGALFLKYVKSKKRG